MAARGLELGLRATLELEVIVEPKLIDVLKETMERVKREKATLELEVRSGLWGNLHDLEAQLHYTIVSAREFDVLTRGTRPDEILAVGAEDPDASGPSAVDGLRTVPAR